MEAIQLDYALLGYYLLVGGSFLFLVFLVSSWLQPRHVPSPAQQMAYECGELPVGGGGMFRFALRYYVYALLFVLFEVELLFVLPWAKVLSSLSVGEAKGWGWVAFIEMSFFIFLLLFGWAYAWRVGGLGRFHPSLGVASAPRRPAVAPESRYEAFNNTPTPKPSSLSSP